MEKRITGIIRWLERCRNACHSGSLESALMDAECARADVERLRNEVWNALDGKHRRKTRGVPFGFAVFRVVLFAFITILASATPLSRLNEGDSIFASMKEDSVALEWVTPDEKMLLGNLRKRLSDGNVTASFTDRQTRSSHTSTAGLHSKREERVSLENENESDLYRKKEPDVPYDRIIALMKTGERALKNEPPVIKIENK